MWRRRREPVCREGGDDDFSRPAKSALGGRGRGREFFYFADGKFTPVRDAAVNEWAERPALRVGGTTAVRVWIGAGDDRVLCGDGKQWRSYRITRHLARPYVSALAETPDGTVWAGSVSEGLFGIKDGEWMPPRTSSGLSDNSALCLLVDREGNLWVGTGGGLDRLRRGNLSALGQDDGLGYGAVQGLAEVAPGVVWAAKPSDGVFRLTTNGVARVNSPLLAALPAGQRAVAGTGRKLLGGGRRGGLLNFRDPAAPENEMEPPALAGLNVLALAQSHDGTMWAGTREGELWRKAAGGWARETNYPRSVAITALAESRHGTLWVGCEGGGAVEYRGGIVTRLDKGAGLSSELIRTLYVDGEDTLWIGTAGGGLGLLAGGGASRSLGAHEGLPDNTISQIMEDGDGRLWLGCNWGVACVRKDENVQARRGADSGGLSAGERAGGRNDFGGMHGRVLPGGIENAVRQIVVLDVEGSGGGGPASGDGGPTAADSVAGGNAGGRGAGFD